MEISSTSQIFNLSNLQKPLKVATEELEAVPYQGNAFDNLNESPALYRSQITDGDFGKLESTLSQQPLPIIDAQNTTHNLSNGHETTRNINLYAISMSEKAQEPTTQATVYIDGSFVALQTNEGELLTPFRPTTEYDIFDKVKQFKEESNGNFSTFIEKLKAEFGSDVSVENFEENDELDYATTHFLLNGTTFDSFIDKQTSQMNDIKVSREMQQADYSGDGEIPHEIQLTDETKAHFVNMYNEVSNMT